MSTIKIRRGNNASLPAGGTVAGEPRFSLDTGQLYIDNGTTNVEITPNTTNVTAAGALMDSEVDADLKTLSLPANTTISAFGASIIDDADEATFKATVNLEIGTDVQAYDADLDAVAGLSSNGLVARTGAGTASVRTITGTSNEVSVANGDGASGNPTLSLPATIDLGGKTSFEIPNGAGGTTVDATGEICIDSTSKTLNFYDGAAEVVLNPIQSKSVTILAPVAGDDFPLHRFDVAVTLVKVSYLCLGGTNWVGQVVEMDSNGGTPTDVHSADITASAGTVNTSTTFSNATLDAGDYLGIETTSISGTPTSLTITIYYRENA